MDGKVVIGTSLDTKQLEKDLNYSKKELQRYEKEAEQLTKTKAKAEIDLQPYKEAIKLLEEEHNKLLQNAKTEDERKNIMFESQTLLNEINTKYSQQIERLNEVDKQIKNNVASQEMLKNKIEETSKKISTMKGFKEVGNGIESLIKKTIKWGTYLFSIRSVYSLISRSMSTLSQYNEDLANKLNAIQVGLATLFEPIVKRIVDWVYKLLGYLNVITKAWFGLDLFAHSQEKALKGSVGSAKELRKQLAGFDEMNVLNDNGTTGIGGADGSQYDLPDMSNMEIPEWIQWIADNKDIVLDFFTTLGAIWAGIKVAKFISELKNLKDGLLGVSTTSGKALTAMEKFGNFIGSALIVGGIALIVKGIFDLITNWNEMTPAEKNAEVALIALGVAFVALGLVIRGAIDSASFGIGEIIGLVVTFVALIVSLVAKLASQEKAIKSVEQAEKDLKAAQEELNNATDNYINAVDKSEEALKKLEEAQTKTGLSGEELNAQVEQEILNYEDMTAEQKEVYKAYRDNEKAQNDLNTSTKELTKAKRDEKVASFEARLAQEAQNGEFEIGGQKAQEFKKDVIDAYENGEISAKQAKKLIGESMSEMSRSGQKAFMEDIPDALKDGLDPKKYETLGQQLRKWWSDLFGDIKDGAKNLTNSVTNTLNSVKGVTVSVTGGSSGFATGGLTYGFAKGGITMPKPVYCAQGSIINMPGRGVPLTQAIGGESGREGIIPLTDKAAMQELGSIIGRNVVINLTNVTNLDNRQIAREQKRINAQNDFAYNR